MDYNHLLLDYQHTMPEEAAAVEVVPHLVALLVLAAVDLKHLQVQSAPAAAAVVEIYPLTVVPVVPVS
jgi:hypothetical protein